MPWIASLSLLAGSSSAFAEPIVIAPCFFVAPEQPRPDDLVIFDASCTTSDGAEVEFDWDLGDGQLAEGPQIKHSYSDPGRYQVNLTVSGGASQSVSLRRDVYVFDTTLPIRDDFNRAAGVAAGWTVATGEWTINGDGQLEGQRSAEGDADAFIWAGSPPGLAAGDITVDFNLAFATEPPLDGTSREAGVVLFAGEPTTLDETFGYSVTWRDSADDFGLLIQRWDVGGSPIELARTGPSDLPESTPEHWTVTVEGPFINVYGDGCLFVNAEDTLLEHAGRVGFVARGRDQVVVIDDVLVQAGIAEPECVMVKACAQVEPQEASPGQVIVFDASCSRIPKTFDVLDYVWRMGDGTTLNGQVIEYGYVEAGEYLVELDVITDRGRSETAEFPVSISGPPLASFLRGDTDAVGGTNISDGIFVLQHLFGGGEAPPCADAADTNDDGRLDLSDGVFVLGFLFLGGAEPPQPFGKCAFDPTKDELGCEAFGPCS